jgi:hypothetical protein
MLPFRVPAVVPVKTSCDVVPVFASSPVIAHVETDGECNGGDGVLLRIPAV